MSMKVYGERAAFGCLRFAPAVRPHAIGSCNAVLLTGFRRIKMWYYSLRNTKREVHNFNASVLALMSPPYHDCDKFGII